MSIFLSSQKIIKDWIDYNNHLNVSYYLLIFDKYGADVLNDKFKMGENSAKTTEMSTMVVETYITYNNEVKEGEEVDIFLTYFDHDKKRLHYRLEMIEKSSKKLSATIELLSLYVNLKERKVSEFENEKLEIMDDYIKKHSLSFKNDDLKFSSKLKK